MHRALMRIKTHRRYFLDIGLCLGWETQPSGNHQLCPVEFHRPPLDGRWGLY